MLKNSEGLVSGLSTSCLTRHELVEEELPTCGVNFIVRVVY
jgi:hypothetical protein